MVNKLHQAKRGKFPKLLLLALLILGALWGAYRFSPRPTPAGIFVITPLEYGDTTLVGIVQKDAVAGEEGNYYLTLEGNRLIWLSATGLDAMIGLQVTARGYLIPPEDENDLPFMDVSELITN